MTLASESAWENADERKKVGRIDSEKKSEDRTKTEKSKGNSYNSQKGATMRSIILVYIYIANCNMSHICFPNHNKSHYKALFPEVTTTTVQ